MELTRPPFSQPPLREKRRPTDSWMGRSVAKIAIGGCRREFAAAVEWLKEWEKQIGPPKPRTSWQDGIKQLKNG
jgi:hypothetical protein